MTLRAPIDAVIFDLDGVLLDTEPLYTAATAEVVSAFGKTYEWSLKRRVMGCGPLESARIVTRELDLPITPEEYLARIERVLQRLFSSTPAMPGAAELLAELGGTAVALGIATSTVAPLYALKARAHAWLSAAKVIVCGDDPEVRAAKPEPDIFLVAARRLATPPERCVVVEDSPNGILAAKRAGMQIIAIPDPRHDDPILEEAAVVARDHSDVRAALRAVLG